MHRTMLGKRAFIRPYFTRTNAACARGGRHSTRPRAFPPCNFRRNSQCRVGKARCLERIGHACVDTTKELEA